MSGWPRKYRTFWCVVDSQGTAHLVSSSLRRSTSIARFLDDASKTGQGWSWWRRNGYSCQLCDIKVRNAVTSNNQADK